MKGQTLINAFVGVAIATVIGGIVFSVLNTSVGLETNDVVNETHNSSGSLPDQFTLDQAPDGVVENSETIYLHNETGGENLLLNSSDHYNITYDTADVEVTDLPTDWQNSLDSNDQYLASYEGKPDGYIESGTTRTVVGFVALGIAVSLFLASLAPIRGA